jgi:predicted dehydrogenase
MTVHHRVVDMEQVRPAPRKPIRIGIIGLSTKPGAWATLAHLPRLASSPNFKIVALCNSTLDSTKAAIKAHNLSAETKAYDTYEGLASDPDVDLYVVSTRADTHYDCALPALKAGGKDIYIEWPLASNMNDAKELVKLAKDSGIRTIIGLQGRASPSVLKVKQLVDSGRLGQIHSVNYQGWINIWQTNAASRRYHYFMDRKIGGNLLTIYGGHTLDSIFFALGELKRDGSEKVMAGNMRKRMRVLEDDGTFTDEEFVKDTPDQMMLMGRLERGDQDIEPLSEIHRRAWESVESVWNQSRVGDGVCKCWPSDWWCD